MTPHPFHPALVHFPIGAWGIATGLDVIFILGTGSFFWENMAAALIGIGLVAALASILAGIADLLSINRTRPELMDKIFVHATIMMGAWSLYFIAILLRIETGELSLAMNVPAAICSIIGFVILMVGGWFGGNLVYTYGANVHVESRKDQSE